MVMNNEKFLQMLIDYVADTNPIKYKEIFNECMDYATESVPAETTKEPIEYVDATPDEGYPLRILKAYRENCDRKWSDNLSGVEPQNPLIKMLNDQCDRRAEFLDSAIKFLEDAQ